MTVKNQLMVDGYDYRIFRNKKYSGPIDNIDQASAKVKDVKKKYPTFFQNVPHFGKSTWQGYENGLPKDSEGFVKVFIKIFWWDTYYYQRVLDPRHPKCFATAENVIKSYLKENTDYFDGAIRAATSRNENEAKIIAQLSLGRCYVEAEKRIIDLQTRSLCYKAVTAVAIIALMVLAVTYRNTN